MKRKTILVLMTLGILVFCNSYASATPITLWAARNLNVGIVTVSNDGNDLTIMICMENGWRIIESHVSVHTDCGLIPQTGSGNAIPGKFIWKKGTEPQSCHSYSIPLSTIDQGVAPDDVLCIAVHAVVKKKCEVTDETAWACCPCGSAPHEFPGKKWDYCFWYTVQ